MSDEMTPKEFLSKCEWEGGFYQGLEYGLTEYHLKPAKTKKAKEFREVVAEAVKAMEIIRKCEHRCLDLAEYEFGLN